MSSVLKSVKKRTDPRFQEDWNRQYATAAHVAKQFDADYDTQLLGDEVGMGKTYVALATMADELSRGPSGNRILLITPSSAILRAKWEQEVRSFSATYVKEGHRDLRPLVLNSYWDLVAALHDHPNLKKKNVTAERLRCVLEVTWDWFVGRWRKKGEPKPTARWTVLEQNRPSDTELSHFHSQFSVSAWHAYLEQWNGARGNELVERLSRKGGMWIQIPERQVGLLKQLFREFTERQDDYEPNVLIVGMRALSKPKSNSWETQRFVTFALAVLLSGKWERTWRAVLRRLQPTGLLLNGTKLKDLHQFWELDLFRTTDCIKQVMRENTLLAAEWQAILDGEASNAGEFFAKLTRAVVSKKLGEANIRLAVVDEVHNWKGSTNGAAEFKADFAPHIERKLVMSATPFQLDAGELRTVVCTVAKPNGQSDLAVTELYQGSPSLVDRCITANETFLDAWDALASDDDNLRYVHAAFESAQSPEEALCALAGDPTAGSTVLALCESAHAYRAAVLDLATKQRKFMVRHLKRNPRRSFHAGEDFSQAPTLPRPALYEARGLRREGNELVSYLAMRIDQRVRQDAGATESAKAHLMRGLTSSYSAFKDSVQRGDWSAAKLTDETRAYATLFEGILSGAPHDKVSATVDHAIANYRCGRKTLIFCDRRATVDEIQGALSDRIRHLSTDVGADVQRLRDHVLGSPLFVDLPIARLIFDRGDLLKQKNALVGRTTELLTQAQVPLNDVAGKRRVLRLLNTLALSKARHELSNVARLCGEVPSLFEDADHLATLRREFLNDASPQPTPAPAGLEQVVLDIFDEYIAAPNLWLCDGNGDGGGAFLTPFRRLLASEIQHVAPGIKTSFAPGIVLGYLQRLQDLEAGLKRVLLRNDILSRIGADTRDQEAAVHAAVRGHLTSTVGYESAWHRMLRFIKQLADADGSINVEDQTNTRHRALWRAVSLRGQRASQRQSPVTEILDGDAVPASTSITDAIVQVLHGDVDATTRVNRCAGFNSPLSPEILICTAIGSEGIDLHRECAEVIHHDLPWNPARLEQRNGRIDRVGSLSETASRDVRIGIPFLEVSYDRFQYATLLRRAQRFELLLGRPDFDPTAGEIEDGNDDHLEEPEPDTEAVLGTSLPASLPRKLVDWFAVDLSVYHYA